MTGADVLFVVGFIASSCAIAAVILLALHGFVWDVILDDESQLNEGRDAIA